MKKEKIKFICTISILLLLVLCFGCITNVERFIEQRVDKADQIQIQSGGNNSCIWKTDHIEINYTYTENDATLILTGTITVLNSIKYSYSKIRNLDVNVNLLDSGGNVMKTESIKMIFTFNGNIPDQIRIGGTFKIPSGSTALCFSYQGEFQGDSKFDRLNISHRPFLSL